jgi:hypothetical protein
MRILTLILRIVWLESDVFKWGEKCFGDEDALKSDEENV